MSDHRPRREDSVEALFERYGPAFRWLVTLTALTGTISCILSSTIVNVALPDIMGALGMGHEEGQLLSTGFLAANTGAMLLNAWAVERFGYRVTYLGSISVFVVASIMAGMAETSGLMVACRVAQGAAAGLLQPLSMQLIFLVFPPEVAKEMMPPNNTSASMPPMKNRALFGLGGGGGDFLGVMADYFEGGWVARPIWVTLLRPRTSRTSMMP